MDNSSETYYEVIGVDANLPTYQMLLFLFASIFMSHSNDNVQDEAKVFRPRIHWLETAVKVVGHLLFGILCSVAVTIAIGIDAMVIEVTILFAMAYYVICSYLQRQKILIWIIRLYQFRAPAKLRSKCPMVPSCSQYMILAVEKFDVFKGVKKGVDRLRRCSEPSQIDYP